jgi:hypothetical protein
MIIATDTPQVRARSLANLKAFQLPSKPFAYVSQFKTSSLFHSFSTPFSFFPSMKERTRKAHAFDATCFIKIIRSIRGTATPEIEELASWADVRTFPSQYDTRRLFGRFLPKSCPTVINMETFNFIRNIFLTNHLWRL